MTSESMSLVDWVSVAAPRRWPNERPSPLTFIAVVEWIDTHTWRIVNYSPRKNKYRSIMSLWLSMVCTWELLLFEWIYVSCYGVHGNDYLTRDRYVTLLTATVSFIACVGETEAAASLRPSITLPLKNIDVHRYIFIVSGWTNTFIWSSNRANTLANLSANRP